jgi:3-methyladenine DNA glycosylase AlkD
VSLVEAIHEELAQRADPTRADGMQRYMKSAMPYRGVTVPVLREVCRSIYSRLTVSSFEEWERAIRSLWDDAEYREERYAALELIAQRCYAGFRTMQALPLYEYLIVSGAWWDLVDGLATHQVRELLKRYPNTMRKQLLAWSRGGDPWLRRTSIICQVGFKAATDQELLFACIEPNLTERDFFLRKAIGWALREYAKSRPDAVATYVAEHPQLSSLSRREALKYVAPNLQSAAASV